MRSVWRKSTIGEEFHVQLGKRLDAAVNRGELKLCINNRGVRWGRIDITQAVWAPLTKADVSELRLKAGDVLVCEGGEIGRASVWRAELSEAYFLNTLHRLRSRRGYNPDVLAAFLERWATTGELLALVGKSSLAHLTKENLLRVPLPVPSPEEQQRIATALRSVDHLIASLCRLIAKKRDIKQGLMQEILTGRTRLPGFSDPWKELLVSDLLDFKNGLNKASQFFGHGTPIINFMDVMRAPVITAERVKGLVSLSREEIVRFAARRGDMFFTRTSESVEEIGTAGVLVDDIPNAVFSGFILRGRPIAPVNTTFLAYQFQLPSVRKQVIATASYTTRALTNGGSLGRVRVLVPSPDEQAAVVATLADTDAELAALERRLESARALKTGMMQELLTGRSRLLVEAAS
ncbi:restriction endonuclease subunit S [Streptomyces albogriseolus]|uniref:restriction endonuclease subunit S n=1 Tax=Streptomyces albogriseolus TaxID=1887 RepID=UPI0036864E46